MRKFSRRSLALLSLLAAASVKATQPALRKDAATKACTLSLNLIALRLVDAQGAPVVGASMRVTRLATKTVLPSTDSFGGPGDFKIMEDGELPDLRPEGEAFEAEFQKEGRTKRVRLRIGMDAQRCHVKLLEGESRVVF